MTKYPDAIDDSTTLPPGTGSNATPINALIEAVEAVETELGVLPSGAYASTRTRLDILEARINNPNAPAPNVTNPFFIDNTGVTIQTASGDPNVSSVSATPGSLYLREDAGTNQSLYIYELDGYWHPTTTDSFVAGGDLAGSSTSQKVIGIQGNPINNIVLGSIQDGYVLTWDNTDGYWKAEPPKFKQNITLVASSTYMILETDNVIATNSTSNTIIITLPTSPSVGDTFIIKDMTGTAASNPITINATLGGGGSVNIDASPSSTLDVNYGSVTLVYVTTNQWSAV